MGQLEITDEHALKSMGDAALGIITACHYDCSHKSKMNEDFVKAYNAEFNRNPDFFSVGAWDGMHLIYAALKKTNGNTDGEALIKAAKGMAWESPRGPISIDPETRDIVQNVYVRKVEKQDGKLVNVEIDKIPNVKDPAKRRAEVALHPRLGRAARRSALREGAGREPYSGLVPTHWSQAASPRDKLVDHERTPCSTPLTRQVSRMHPWTSSTCRARPG